MAIGSMVIRKITIKKDYSYNEILQNNIETEKINAVILSQNDLSENMNKLLSLLKSNPNINIYFKDYESVIFLDKILKDMIPNTAILIDDEKIIDRDYIDLTQLKNIKLTIPLNYLMHGVKFNDYIELYCFKVCSETYKDTKYVNNNGNSTLSLEDYKKILEKIEELKKYNITDTKQLVMLISDFIQSRTQYIDTIYSTTGRGKFCTPEVSDKDGIYTGLIETVLNKNSGLCMGIANFSTVLLNNSAFNLPVESVFSGSHTWNSIIIDGKRYYFDNTWEITRTDNPHPDALITLSFSKKHLLIGKKTIDTLTDHKAETLFSYHGEFSQEDAILPEYSSKFEYLKTPPYKSYKI